MTARAAFRQDDVSRAVRGVKAAGLPVARVVVVEGRIEVIVGEADPQIDDWRSGSPLYDDADGEA